MAASPVIAAVVPTLRDYFARSYVPRRLVGGSKSRRHQYEVQFRHLHRFLGREPLLSDLDDETLGAAMVWLHEGLDRGGIPRAAATVNKFRAHLLAIATLAAKKRLLAEFPDLPQIPEPEPMPVAWRRDEVGRLLAATAKMPGTVAGIPAGDWWFAFILAMLDTGERTWALMAARREWFDQRGRTLTVAAHVRKGRTKTMIYALKASTVRAIAKTIRRGEMLFPWPHCRATFYHHFRRLLRLAKLPTGRKRMGQGLRITFASHLEKHGGDATEALRHSDRRVTLRSYIDRTLTGSKNHARLIPEWETKKSG